MNMPADPLPNAPKYDGSREWNGLLAGVVGGLIVALIGGIVTVWWLSATKLFAQLPTSIKPIILALEMPVYAAIFLGVSCFAITLIHYLRRFGLWDANSEALEGQRVRMEHSESVGDGYARMVERALDWTDSFFGDAGKAAQSWWPRAFGLREAAPLWTAASYDKCLLIALVYPIACIYAVWAFSGQAGDAGAALGLIEGAGAAHIGRITNIVVMIGSWIVFARAKGWKRFAGFSLAAVLGAFAGADFFALVLAGAVAFAVTAAIGGALAIALAVAVVFTVASTNAIIGAASIAGIFVFSGTFAFSLLTGLLYFKSYQNDRIKIYYWTITIALVVICLLLPVIGKSVSKLEGFVALLYFLTLLTAINAPFDWVALGITRALLRKGLEQRGLSPLLYGVIDLLISLFTVALLGVVVLLVTQLFNAMTLLGGASELVFDPLPALRAMTDPATRYETQYYWLYLMLLTTQLPAILNLAAGFLSVIRTRDWGNGLVRKLVAQGAGMGTGARVSLAAVQSVQVSLAVTIGFFALVLIYYGIIKGLEPLFGGTLLSGLLSLAEADWPARLFGV